MNEDAYYDRLRCTPCRQRRGKDFCGKREDSQGAMHPVQAAPRQSSARRMVGPLTEMHPVQAAPRQSSARRMVGPLTEMHPVQAAPRQSNTRSICRGCPVKMHPVQAAPRQRSPSAACIPITSMHPVQAAPRQSGILFLTLIQLRCTPCRQRRGKVLIPPWRRRKMPDAPRAGSAEAKKRQNGALVTRA